MEHDKHASKHEAIQTSAFPLKSRRRAFLGGALASAALVMAVRPPLQLWPSITELTELTADYRTGTGEQRQIALSDQVVIEMNTQTRINLRADGDAADAIELLAGEVEIQTGVSRIQPFIVFAGGGRLHALAARFNVRHTGPDVCVTCIEGAVELEHGNQRQLLKSGHQLIYDMRGIRTATAADPVQVTSWRKGSLTFVDTPLAEVVDEINRYREGRVVLRNAELGQRRVRMHISIRHIDRALAMICKLYGAKTTQLPAGIVLLR